MRVGMRPAQLVKRGLSGEERDWFADFFIEDIPVALAPWFLDQSVQAALQISESVEKAPPPAIERYYNESEYHTVKVVIGCDQDSFSRLVTQLDVYSWDRSVIAYDSGHYVGGSVHYEQSFGLVMAPGFLETSKTDFTSSAQWWGTWASGVNEYGGVSDWHQVSRSASLSSEVRSWSESESTGSSAWSGVTTHGLNFHASVGESRTVSTSLSVGPDWFSESHYVLDTSSQGESVSATEWGIDTFRYTEHQVFGSVFQEFGEGGAVKYDFASFGERFSTMESLNQRFGDTSIWESRGSSYAEQHSSSSWLEGFAKSVGTDWSWWQERGVSTPDAGYSSRTSVSESQQNFHTVQLDQWGLPVTTDWLSDALHLSIREDQWWNTVAGTERHTVQDDLWFSHSRQAETYADGSLQVIVNYSITWNRSEQWTLTGPEGTQEVIDLNQSSGYFMV
jgi:hypothetical protein